LKAGKDIVELANCEFDLISEDTLRELASIYRSDGTLVLSDFELKLLENHFNIPNDLLCLTRFHYSDPAAPRSFEDRENFMMIGNFRHPPNTDGIWWFLSEVWPLIRKELPTVEVSIYGAYPPREMMKLTDPKSGFYVRGPIENQFEALSTTRVNLAPLRFGAGIKGKITDGWWTGTPVVTTPIGAEGMCESLPWGGEIGMDAVDFAKKAVTLYTDEISWQKAQNNSLQLIRELYSQELQSKSLLRFLETRKSQVSSARKKNIIGAILSHQLYRSTKYFSKWIEEKNRKCDPERKVEILSGSQNS
jgi:glycosyltransferase involved in cell wall biosynthesis